MSNSILLAVSVMPKKKELNAKAIQNLTPFLSALDDSDTEFLPYTSPLDDKTLRGFINSSVTINEAAATADDATKDLREVTSAATFVASWLNDCPENPQSIIICRDREAAEQIKKLLYEELPLDNLVYVVTVRRGFGNYPSNYDPESVTRSMCVINTKSSCVIRDTKNKQEDTISVNTPIGTLKAYKSNVPDYPEIYITFTPNDKDESYETDMVSAGIDLYNNPENKSISLHMYANPYTEDYTHKEDIDSDEIVKAIETSNQESEG